MNTSQKLSALFLILAFGTPLGASAATLKPTCSLAVTTDEGKTTIKKEDTVYITPGEDVTIAWSSKKAESAKNGEGDTIERSGSQVVRPTESESYAYIFTSGSKKVACSVTLELLTGTISSSTLNTTSAKPKLSGTATTGSTVSVEVRKQGSSKKVFTSKEIKVSRGAWKVSVTKKLSNGVYDVTLRGPKGSDITLATGTLTVGKSSGTGSLSVALIPLLGGGTARAGTTVPVSYLQVRNTGKTATTITGFKLQQQGSASVSAVTGFSTVDDKGGSRGATTGSNVFANGVGYAPTSATIAPGELRLFTIKANIAGSLGNTAGKSLSLVVSGIEANGSVRGSFPIPGTTWMLSN